MLTFSSPLIKIPAVLV